MFYFRFGFWRIMLGYFRKNSRYCRFFRGARSTCFYFQVFCWFKNWFGFFLNNGPIQCWYYRISRIKIGFDYFVAVIWWISFSSHFFWYATPSRIPIKRFDIIVWWRSFQKERRYNCNSAFLRDLVVLCSYKEWLILPVKYSTFFPRKNGF